MTLLTRLFACATALLTASTAAVADGTDAQWTPLLDAKLSQWEPFLGVPPRTTPVAGYTYAKNTPIGLRDPNGVFTVKEVDGEPVLHVSGEIFGGLTTLKSHANYHLRFQFRWGEKRWAPRLHVPRDSGVLYHCIGEHGAYSHIWMRSVEYQIQEKDVGDFYPLCGTRADFPAKRTGNFWRYTPDVPLRGIGERVAHSTDYQEKPNGEWNTAEIIVVGADAIHILNGRVVNALRNIRYVEKADAGKKEIPITAGKIQIQSEGAEIEFRRIEIRPAEKIKH
ncbi:MAG: DUF1080 domain-containing protein [Puniceicoccales bacterium]|jgi:hypothetical protein|nr:DUF1080 domain-containing protein [Puniceicoccales bacterium]